MSEYTGDLSQIPVIRHGSLSQANQGLPDGVLTCKQVHPRKTFQYAWIGRT
ncbi:hypothetical protein [Pseudomonas asplenii]|uniref:hypothetical protein n=1 Tax=Pseudomonas asplenii TaxID=53407 RepID=UPI00039F08C5|nr:hypothetical protein [Pseudomonas fuscovaginae]